jgi:hypothetical protein
MPGQGLVALVWPPLMVLWPLLLLRPHPKVLGLHQPLPLRKTFRLEPRTDHLCSSFAGM